MAIKFIILGAEGCSGVQHEPWVRLATDEELQAFKADLITKNNGKKGGDHFTDRAGRAYWLVAVDVDHPECPQVVKERCELFGKMRYLDE